MFFQAMQFIFTLLLLQLFAAPICTGADRHHSKKAGTEATTDNLTPQLVRRALTQAVSKLGKNSPDTSARLMQAIRSSRAGAFHPTNEEPQTSPECGLVFGNILSAVLALVLGDGGDLRDQDKLEFVKWLDAIAKPEAGIVLGNFRWIGSREECEGLSLPIYEDVNNASSLLFRTNGRYCTFKVEPRGNGSFSGTDLGSQLQRDLQLAFCLPNPCKGQDAEIVVNYVINLILSLLGPSIQGIPGLGGIVDVIKSYRLAVQSCAVTSQEAGSSITYGAIAMMSITGLLVFLILLATVVTSAVEHFYPATKGVYMDICRAFCLRSNLGKLFAPASTDSTACLNGIRVFSIFWVILGHTLLMTATYFDNILNLLTDFRKRWQAVIIMNATTSVDTFFLLSGTLVAMLFFRRVNANRRCLKSFKFWAIFYLHRYWRLTPALMFFVFWYLTLSPYFGDGALKPEDRVPADVKACQQVWWTLPLYVQNFVRVPETTACLGHTWYLANDMQMYLASPLMLLPFVFGGMKIGAIVVVAFVTVSMICTGVINSAYGFRRGHLNFVPGEQDGYYAGTSYYELVYIKPYCRMGAYAIGILLGYVLATRKSLRIPMPLVALGWLVATAGGLALLYLIQPQIAGTGGELTVPQVTTYWTFLRPGFALCVAWVVLACVYGYGGPVAWLLSFSWFAPLARLTYCAYISHVAVMVMFNDSYDAKFHFSDSLLILLYLGYLTASFLVSLVLSMLIEAPLLGLEKALLRRQEVGGGEAMRRSRVQDAK